MVRGDGYIRVMRELRLTDSDHESEMSAARMHSEIMRSSTPRMCLRSNNTVRLTLGRGLLLAE